MFSLLPERPSWPPPLHLRPGHGTRQETPERQAPCGGQGDVEQHLICVAWLGWPATTRDFTEFVVRPYLDVAGVRDAFMVDWHTDMLVRAWRLARRQQRLRRHDGIPLNPTRTCRTTPGRPRCGVPRCTLRGQSHRRGSASPG